MVADSIIFMNNVNEVLETQNQHITIRDFSLNELKQMQFHPLFSGIKDKILKEISDRENGLRFAPSDHTIFVYNGQHRVNHIENNTVVSFRTNNASSFDLVLDVLNIQGHYFYATYCGNLPKNDRLLARLLPVEILHKTNDPSWPHKMVEYRICYPECEIKKNLRFFENLMAHSIYSKKEVKILLSKLQNVLPFLSNTSKTYNQILNTPTGLQQFIDRLNKLESTRDKLMKFDTATLLLELKKNHEKSEIKIAEKRAKAKAKKQQIEQEKRKIQQNLKNQTKLNPQETDNKKQTIAFNHRQFLKEDSGGITTHGMPKRISNVNIVYLYSHKNTPRNLSTYELVSIMVKCANTEDAIPITAYYSRKDDRYFINSETYLMYKTKYGLPYIKLRQYQVNDNPYYLKEESDLHVYGYSVSKTTGLDQEKRHQLIAQLIDAGLMQSYEIVNHLEWLIHTHKHNERFSDACVEWKNDLSFTQHYKTKVDHSQIYELKKPK